MNVEHAQLHMNIFDAIVLGVFCLSALVAFFRGFVREVLSLGAWVGAAVITMYLFPQATQIMKGHVKNESVAAGSAALGTYLCALIFLSLINSVIIRYLKTGAEVGIIDNALGLLFGALRGAFILSLAFLIMSAVIPKDKPPEWVKTSITRPYLMKGSEVLAKIAPRYLNDLESIVKKQKEAQEGKPEEDAPVDENSQDKGEVQADANKTLHKMLNTLQPASQNESKGTQ